MTDGTPYSRPLGGVQETVGQLDRDAVAARHAEMVDPAKATLVVAGDLTGIDIEKLAQEHLGAIDSLAQSNDGRSG